MSTNHENNSIIMSLCVVPTNPLYSTEIGENDTLFMQTTNMIQEWFDKQFIDVVVTEKCETDDICVDEYLYECGKVFEYDGNGKLLLAKYFDNHDMRCCYRICLLKKETMTPSLHRCLVNLGIEIREKVFRMGWL